MIIKRIGYHLNEAQLVTNPHYMDSDKVVNYAI